MQLIEQTVSCVPLTVAEGTLKELTLEFQAFVEHFREAGYQVVLETRTSARVLRPGSSDKLCWISQ